MTVKKTQLVAPKAPRLPSPRDEYSADQQDKLNSTLRTYFAQIDAAQSSLLGPTGARFLDFPYAVCYQNASQTSASSTTINAVKFPTAQEGAGITVVGDTKLTVSYPGLYTFSFLLQLLNADASSHDVYFWLRKNGIDVDNTAHRITSVVGYSRPALDFTLQLEQADYVELMWNTTNTTVSLAYTAAQTNPVAIPAIPSSYVNVQFMSAVNSSSEDVFIPPAPPAPTPTPTPSPAPTSGPAPTPAPTPAPAGDDTNVTTIFTALGAGDRAWWYPAYDADRIEFADGTGTASFSTSDQPFGRLVDHSGNGFNLLWSADPPIYRTSPERMNIYSHPSTVALGGTSTTGFVAAFAVRFDSGTYSTLFSDVSGAADAATNGMYLRFAAGTLTFSVGTGAGRVQVQQAGLIEGAAASPYVIIVWWDGSTINLKVNDLATVSTACTAVSAGSSAMQVFSNPFADLSLGGWEGWDHLYGMFYGGFVFKSLSMSSTNRDTLRHWLALQAGVTLSGATPTPAPTPAPPAPSPAPAPPSVAPTISNLARHPKDMLKIGDYYIEDNRWQAALAGIEEGAASYQFVQEVERYLTEGANGEIAARFKWYWPRYRQNGTEYDHGSREVKAFPCIIYGAKPGYDSQGTQWPAYDFAVRLPDGASVASAPPGTPDPIAADWQPLGGSVSTTSPAGSSGGVLPLQLPVQTLNAQVRHSFTTSPTGVGHLSFDIWLQETSDQGNGFTSASITHEVMIPLTIWGNYGAPHTVGGAWSKDPANYSHDVTIGGTVYKVYVWQNKPTSPVTGEYTPNVYWPGVQYNFGGLNGAFTNEETGSPRIGWKFIVYEAANIATSGHPATDGLIRVDIAGILADIRSRSDTRGTRWARGTEYIGSIELGCEFVYGHGDLTIYDYNVTANALPPAPTPAPTPAPSPIEAGPSTATFSRPAGSISIEDYGAVAGGPDCETAIWNATDAALLTAEKIVWFPPGVWHWQAFALEARGVQYVGAGYTQTTLYADDWEWASIFLKDDGAAVKQMTLTGNPAPSRQANWERTKICSFGATNFTVRDCWIEDSPAASIQTQKTGGASGTASSGGYIGYNRIVDSLSDSIHITASATDILVEYNVISGSGDDGIACVSYNGDGTPVTFMTAQHNIITDNVSGRGMSVLGGEDVYYYNNYIEGNPNWAGMYIAQELSWDTFAAKRVKAENNTIKNCGNLLHGHPGIFVFSDGASSTGIVTNDDIWLLLNDIVQNDERNGIRYFGPQTNVKFDQNRYTGGGTDIYSTGGGTTVTLNVPYTSGTVGYVQPGTTTPAPSPAPGTAPFFPFASRLDGAYPYGIQPNNYTLNEMDLRVISVYNHWKNRILRKAPTFTGGFGLYDGQTITDGYYVSNSNGTFSEAIGYGMLITVVMAGYDPDARTYFDGMYKVARGRAAYGNGSQYLMDWKLDAGMNSLGGGWNAADGDLDIALSLLMADRQWGSSGAINYRQQALNTIAALKSINFASTGEQMYWSQNLSRVSDYMIGHFRSFKLATGDGFWDLARTRSLTLVTNVINAYSPTAKLVPDFIMDPGGNPRPSTGNLIEGDWEGHYGPNSCRVPWRWGTDYVWSGDSGWKTVTQNITQFLYNDCGGNPFNSHDEWYLNGDPRRPYSRYLAEGPQGPAMCGAMVDATFQTYLNTLFTAHSDNPSNDYYDLELQLFGLIVASGNWWRPT